MRERMIEAGVVAIILSAVVYAGIAFAAWQVNPVYWSVAMRGGLAAAVWWSWVYAISSCREPKCPSNQ